MKYALKNYNAEDMARARITDANVSKKIAMEVADMIRNKPAKKAKLLLQNILDKKAAVPYKKFNKDIGHKKGIGPGRYPEKTAKVMLNLLNLAISNAENKSMGGDLKINHIVVNKGTVQWHYGRQRRRKMKRAHLEMAVIQIDTTKDKKTEKDKVPKDEEKKLIVKNVESIAEKYVETSKETKTVKKEIKQAKKSKTAKKETVKKKTKAKKSAKIKEANNK